MFEITPFGITFNSDASGIWYFFDPVLSIGNFIMRIGFSLGVAQLSAKKEPADWPTAGEHAVRDAEL